LGEEIRKRRLDLNLRQIDVAKIIGCDEMTVVNWEKGHAAPRINHMPRVVKFLGFNPFTESDNLSHRLINHRKSRGITQKEFAQQLGVDPSTLARWERGERTPGAHFLERIVSVAR
jgi:transcriptional regulator with XRE-family HTH domain